MTLTANMTKQMNRSFRLRAKYKIHIHTSVYIYIYTDVDREYRNVGNVGTSERRTVNSVFYSSPLLVVFMTSCIINIRHSAITDPGWRLADLRPTWGLILQIMSTRYSFLYILDIVFIGFVVCIILIKWIDTVLSSYMKYDKNSIEQRKIFKFNNIRLFPSA